jgi:hypothetical protein
MFAQHSRSVLLAGLLTAAMFAPAWSGDGDAAKLEPTGADLPLAMATSPPVHPGPVVARKSLPPRPAQVPLWWRVRPADPNLRQSCDWKAICGQAQQRSA